MFIKIVECEYSQGARVGVLVFTRKCTILGNAPLGLGLHTNRAVIMPGLGLGLRIALSLVNPNPNGASPRMVHFRVKTSTGKTVYPAQVEIIAYKLTSLSPYDGKANEFLYGNKLLQIIDSVA